MPSTFFYACCGTISVMNASRLRLLALFSILGGAGLLVLGLWRPLTIVVDGETLRTRVWSRTVGGALAEAGVWVRPEDAVFPPANAPLRGRITIRRAAPVWIAGERLSLHLTTQSIAGNVLLEEGMRLFPGDRLWVDGNPAPPETRLDLGRPHTLQVSPAARRRVQTPFGVERVTLGEAGLADALWGAGYSLHNGDRFVPGWDALPSESGAFLWAASRPVRVATSNGVITGMTTAETVGDALAQIGLAPQGLDYTLPPADAPLPEDGLIRLVRVRETVAVEQTPLPFDVQYQPLPDVEIGEIRIVQAGEYGVQARQVRLRYEDRQDGEGQDENGQETARTVEASYLVREPQPRIVGYGTKAVKRTLQTPEGPITYWRAAQVYVTSYSPCRLGIPNYCNETTASGQRLRKGLVAVTRRQYAALAGSQVYVPGYGIGTVADIGAGVPGREWLDVGFTDEDFEPWHQVVTVYYLWPPPEDLTWLIP